MKPKIKVGIFPNSSYAVQIAALRLSQFVDALTIVINDISEADFVIMESKHQLSADNQNNWFSIDNVALQSWR